MFKSSNDRDILSVLQEPLSLESRPFEVQAKRLGVNVDQVIQMIRDYICSGVIRRVAGIIKHDSAGFRCNAMVAFEVDSRQCDSAGEMISGFPFISHCYRRSAYPDWPYNLYAMMHARDEQEFEQRLKIISNLFEYKSMKVLPTVKEFKKSLYHISISAPNKYLS